MTDAERPFRSLARPDDAGRPRPRLRRRPPRAPAPRPAPASSARTLRSHRRSPTMSALIPYLVVRDARAAIAWYAEAFGARTVGDPYLDDDRIGHAELEVAGATALPGRPVPRARPDRAGRRPGRRSPCTSRCPTSTPPWPGPRPPARPSSARPPTTPVRPHRRDRRPLRPPLDAADRPAAADPGPAPGRRRLPDPAGARRRAAPATSTRRCSAGPPSPAGCPTAGRSRAPTPMIGIGGGSAEPGAVPMYAVDDIEVAVAAVRTAGGEAGEIERQSYGLVRALPRRPGPAVLAGSAGLTAVRRGPPAGSARAPARGLGGRRPARRRGRRCRGPRPRAARRPAAGRGARAGAGRPPG